MTITEGNSGTTKAAFTVSLSAPAQATDVTFDIATQNDTALSGSDYVARTLTGQVIPAGQTSYTFEVTINGDTTVEPDETFLVNVTNVTGANATDSQGVGTIQHDDFPTLSIDDVSASEGNSGPKIFTFHVTLSAAAPATVTFDIATADGTAQDGVPGGEDTDYAAHSSNAQTIAAGASSFNFDVTVNGDAVIEPNETFFVDATNVSGATVLDGQGQGIIQNDDSPALSIDDVSMSEGDTGLTTFTFTVSSTLPAPAGGITFDIATADGSAHDHDPATEDNDYIAKSLTNQAIPATQVSYIFEVTVNRDTLFEPNQTFFVNISNVSGASVSDNQGQGTIQNDDTSPLVISQVYGGGGNSGATFQNDFVEIFNRGTTTVDFAVTPYSMQYASSSGSFSSGNKVDLTTGTLAVGQYYLLKLGSNGAVGSVFTADISNTGVNMSAADGKVALVAGTAVATTSGCPSNVTVGDLVGYGGANCSETAPVAALSATRSALRKSNGCTDTDNNLADFTTPTLNAGTPPRNANSQLNDCSAADLGITKTDSPDPVVSGSDVTYTITVTNSGPATAQSVVVTDNLPGNVTFVSCGSTGGGVCDGTGNNRTISFSSLASGASATITLVATANGPAGTPIDNAASVGSTTSDPNSANNSATASTAVGNPTSADLLISKSDSPDPVTPGAALTYTISLTNNGPDTAQSVVVTDNLSSSVNFVDCVSDQGGVCGGNAMNRTVSFASLANGVTATITIHVTVGSSLTSGTIISNTVSVTSATADPSAGNNTDSEDTTVQEASPGEVLISEFRTRGPLGTSDEFIELYNPTSATVFIGGLKVIGSNGTGGTAVRATITAGTTLGSGCHYLLAFHTASCSNCYSGTVTADQTYTTSIADDGGIAFTRADGTTIIDQVGMSSGSAYKEGTTLTPLATNVEQSYERKPGGASGNGTDTNNNLNDFSLNSSSSNPQNSSSGCLDLSTADLAVTKTDSPDPVVSGSDVTYTIVVTNNGPGTAQSVVVTDNLPGEVTFVSCGSTGSGVCGGTGNNRTVTFASLASGASATITLVATANGAGGTTITNTATVGSSTTDPTPANDSSTATTDVQAPPPVVDHVDVSPTTATINRGNTQQFSATAFDSSNQAIPGATFTWSSSDITIATIDTNGLATGVGIGTVTITATTADGLGGTISGTAQLTVQVPLVINEVNADVAADNVSTTAIEGDSNRDGVRNAADDEFVELLNNSTASVDLSNVVITDATNAATSRFTFPNGTTLAAGRAVVVFGGGTPPVGDPALGGALVLASSISLSLNDGGDTVTVKLNIGGSDVQIAQVIYGGAGNPPAPSDQSLTRSPDAEVGTSGGTFVAHTAATNPAGRTFSPGTRTDGIPFGSPAITRLEVLPATAAINIGATQLFTGHAYSNVGGPEIEVLNVSFIWDSSDTAKATVAPTTGQTTTATAHAAGSPTIRARAGGQQGTAALTVNSPPPTLNISNVTQPETNGATTFTFQVSLSSPAPAGGVTFDIATADGTAQDGGASEDNDYVAKTVIGHTIPEGSSTFDFAVTVNGDSVVEPDETFFVNVTNVTGATVGDGQGLGTIQNDDSPPASADVSLTKSDSPDPVAIGNDITYTIHVTNAGPDAANNAVLADTVPTNTTFRSIAPPAGWTCPTAPAQGSTGSISCSNAAFGVGSADFTLVVRVNTTVTDGTTITNSTAAISSSASDPDPSNNNNTASPTTTTVKKPLLVITQIYPGGGLTNASFTNDFIEIFNSGTTTVDFATTNYSVQFLSTGGATWVKTDLTTKTIAPGQYFLIQGASGGAVGNPLPSPDAAGTINLTSTTPGKVALVLGTTLLVGNCPGDDGLTPFNPASATIVDFVGYGGTAATANHCYEGSGPALFSTSVDQNRRSTIRTSSCTDTNVNSADFTNPTNPTGATPPVPRNTATTLAPCP